MIEHRTAQNSAVFSSLGDAPEVTASASLDRFVVLRPLTRAQVVDLFADYRNQHEKALRKALLARRIEVEPKSIQTKVKNGQERLVNRLQSPYMLQASAIPHNAPGGRPKWAASFHIVLASAVKSAMAQMGILGNYQPSKSVYVPAWAGILDEPYEFQRLIAERVIGPEPGPMTWMMGGNDLCNASVELVAELLNQTSSADEFLGLVATQAGKMLAGYPGSGTRMRTYCQAKDADRPLAMVWFAAWLAVREVWLLPLNSWHRITDLVPAALNSLWTDLILTDEKREFVATLERDVLTLSRASANRHMGHLRFLRWLPMVSTFCRFDQTSAEFLVHLREVTADSGKQTAAAGFAIRGIWQAAKKHLKASMSVTELIAADERVNRVSRLKKKGQRPWQWVDDPDYKPHANERYVPQGFVPEPRLTSHVHELRRLLLSTSRKELNGVLSPLNVWLGYLATIPDADRPTQLLQINRNKHINSLGTTDWKTLTDFAQTAGVPPRQLKLCNTVLKRFWTIAQTASGRSELLCPIDPDIDSPQLRTRNGRPGRTHRRALDEEILEFIIAENRRDDFAFSRTRTAAGSESKNERTRALLDWRRVMDPETGRPALQWWPGMAVLLDLMLNIPLRKFQSRFLDSGEGDELTLDIASLEYSPNPLATATKGRQESFFSRQSLRIIEDQPILGMHVNTNKSGDHYFVPWIPDEVARNVQRVIEWQKRFNPIAAPIRAAEPTYLEEYVPKNLHVDVYPIFRDPARQDHQPVGEPGVMSYFLKLLKHCQAKFNTVTGRKISFFYGDGAPIFDMHSLRVTGVTVLLEKGVDPKIVQHLVGHASQEMTLYYHAMEDRRVHNALLKALEERKPTVEKLLSMDPQAYGRFERFLFNTSLEEPTLGTDMLRREILARAPGWDLMHHGICPGADCRSGGKSSDSKNHVGVWREKACSLCRYRVTGPPFLNGLVLNLNRIMWELRETQRTIAALQDKRDELDDAGKPIGAISGEISRRKVDLDHLWDEWFAELVYVKRSEALLNEWTEAAEASEGQVLSPVLLSPLGAEGLKAQLKSVHDLPFLSNLLQGATIVQGFVPPRGVREDRNAMLLEIARRNDLSDIFYRLERTQAEAALNLFADAVLEEVSPPRLDDLVGGAATLDQFPGLHERLISLTQSFNASQSLGLVATLEPPSVPTKHPNTRDD